MDKCIAWSTHLYCVQEICPKHQISYTQNVHEMPSIQCIGNVDEISCVLATGNVHEIVSHSYCIRKFPGNVEISCSKKCTYH